MKYSVTVNGSKYEVEVQSEGTEEAITKNDVKPQETEMPKESIKNNVSSGKGQLIFAPMPGKIIAIKVSGGSKIKKNEVLFVLEAMKMENEIVSPVDGVVSNIFVEKNAMVNPGDKLIQIV